MMGSTILAAVLEPSQRPRLAAPAPRDAQRRRIKGRADRAPRGSGRARRWAGLLLVLVGLCVIWGASIASFATGVTWEDSESIAMEDADGPPCAGDCPGDDADGECPPGCDACPCCPAAVSPAATCGGLFAPPCAQLALTDTVGASCPVPDGALSRVFHPPRRAAA